MAHHVLLVPGFFGFANLGDFAYFQHVRDLLAEVGPSAGLDGEVRVVHTVPTASIRRRAARLAEAITETLDAHGGEMTLIGHSSGGLDARLVVTPDASLPTHADVERAARAVRSIVTVSAPHHGTPVAHLFNSLLGQQLLKLLSLSTIYTLRAGRLPIGVVLRLAGFLLGIARRNGPPSGVLEQIFVQLLSDFSADRRAVIEQFFASVGNDQDLLAQITPAGMDVFEASTGDRAGVRYGCVVSRGRPPGLGSALRAGLDPYAQATHALYLALYRLAARTPRLHAARITKEQSAALVRAYGARVDRRANDGMVPTLSQVRGDVICAAWADHLDVIGHFHEPRHVPPHLDWLVSGSGFTRPQFEDLWGEVARWAGGASAATGGARGSERAKREIVTPAASGGARPGSGLESRPSGR
jgi:triacylglycerol lipase